MAEKKSFDQAAHSSQTNNSFASMDREQQREIASQGGKATHEKGTAHQENLKEAGEAEKHEVTHSQGGKEENQISS
jgi:hypothetical protein